MTTAAIYARVSSSSPGEESSIQDQIDVCTKYAEDKGFTVVKTYDEPEAISGAKSSRPAMNEAILGAAAGDFEHLIVRSHTRFARDVAVSSMYVKEFNSNEVTIHYVNDNTVSGLDSETFDWSAHVLAGVAQDERLRIRRRTRRGRNSQVTKGFQPVGKRIVYGYKRNKTAAGTKMALDKNEAPFVKRIFKEWNAKKTSVEIAEGLNRDKVKRHETTPWTRYNVMRVLKNEAYIGNWYYGKSRMTPQGKREQKPRDEWLKSSVPRIISDAVWKKAQVRVASVARQDAKNNSYHYMVRGRITCSVCSHNFTGRSSVKTLTTTGKNKRFGYYVHTTEHTCVNTTKRLSQDKLEGHVKNELIEWLTDPKKKWKNHLEESQENTKELNKRIEKLVKQQGKLAEQAAKAQELLVKEVLSTEDYQAQANRIDDENELLDSQLAELRELVLPDLQHTLHIELGQEAMMHDIEQYAAEGITDKDLWHEVKGNISDSQWDMYIEEFDVKVSVLPDKKYLITSTIGKKKVSVTNGQKQKASPKKKKAKGKK